MNKILKACVATAVIIILLFSATALATPVCKDINTDAMIDCPADSSVMPWDISIQVREMTEKDFEYIVFVAGVVAIVVFTAPVF